MMGSIKYFVGIVLFLCLSCTEEQDCCMNVDTVLSFSVANATGMDLLNPENPGTFEARFIKVYYLKDGVPEYQNSGEKKFSIFKREDKDKFVISIGAYSENSTTTTLLKWNDNETDTIKCNISRTSSSTLITKIWFNDELKWDGNGEKYFEIVK